MVPLCTVKGSRPRDQQIMGQHIKDRFSYQVPSMRIGGSLQFQAMENKIYTACFFTADIERGVYHTILLTADSDLTSRLDLRKKRASVMKDRPI